MHGDMIYKIETKFYGTMPSGGDDAGLKPGATVVFTKQGSGPEMARAYRQQLCRLREWRAHALRQGSVQRPLWITTYVLEEDAGAGGMWIPRQTVGAKDISYSFKPTMLLGNVHI